MGAKQNRLLIVGFLSILIWRLVGAELIRAVVAVDDRNQLARQAVEQAFGHHQHQESSSTTNSLRNQIELDLVVIDGRTATDKQLCDRIFPDGRQSPSFMIDLTEPSDGHQHQSIKNLAREMGLPTISTTSGGRRLANWRNLDDGHERQTLIHVDSPGDVIPSIIKDLAQHYNHRELAILHDDSFPLESKQPTTTTTASASGSASSSASPASSLLPNPNARHVLDRLLASNSADDYQLLLNRVKKVKLFNLFAFGSIGTLSKLLEAANRNEMLGPEYTWYLITKGKGKLKCSTCQTTVHFAQPLKSRLQEYDHNTTLATLVTSEQKVDAFFYYDLTRFILETVTEMANKSDGQWPSAALNFPKCGKHLDDQMKEQRKSIRLAHELAQESFYGMFGRLVFSDHQMVSNNYQEVVLRINKVKINKDQPQKNTKLAEWEYEGHSGTLMFTSRQESGSTSGKPHYKIVTLIQAPFVMQKADNTSTGNDQFYGYCIDLLNEIQNFSAPDTFTYTIEVVEDGKFGNKEADNTWNGLIGELARKKVDIALGPISVMAERETVVDFTVPYYDLVGITILMKKPSVPSHLFKFLTVLETNVWLCILAAYFFTSFLMYLFDRLSPYSYHNNKEKYKDDDEKREFTLKECLWFCMTSLTPQGGGEAPRNLSGRLVAATWWLFGFIIIASYTANLAAFLTVSRLDSPIESLDDLAKQYKIKYAPQEGTASMTYFERMAGIEEKFYEIWKDMSLNDSQDENERAKLAVWDYPVSDKYTKIWAQIQEAEMPKSWASGVERVKKSDKPNEGFAFIAEATQVKYAVMTNCDLQSVGNEFSRKPLALAVQQGSELKDKLSSAILKLLNQRKLESLKEKWWNRNPEKKVCSDNKKQSDGISINNIGGVFIVIFIGVILAVITLAIEYWYFKGKRDPKVVAVKDYQGYPNQRRFPNVGHPPVNHIGHPVTPALTMGPMAGIRH